MTAGDAAPRNAWFPCMDGLRAIAATTVLLHHAGFSTGASFRDGGEYLARMDSGVTIFFLLSGFLLYRPFVAAHLEGRAPMPARRFYGRRVLRIFPAYWLALTCIVLFFGTTLPTFTDVWVHYGLLQIYDIDRYFNAISQSWSLATELSFYLVVPAFAWLVRKAARDFESKVAVELSALALVFGASMLVRGFLFPIDEGSSAFRVLLRYWLPANMGLFAVGMAMAVLSVWLRGRDVRLGGWFPYVSWAIGLGAFWLVSNHAGLEPGLTDATPRGEWAKHLLYLLFALGLVAPAVFGDQTKGPIRWFLRWRPMAALGLVSYGVYLWHQAWLHQVAVWFDQPLFETPYWSAVVPAFIATVLTATASYWLVEKPILKLKDRNRTPRDEAVVAAVPAP